VPLYQKATTFESVAKRGWLEQSLVIVNVKDKADRIKKIRIEVQKKLKESR